MSGELREPSPNDAELRELASDTSPLGGGPGRPPSRNVLRMGLALLSLALIAGALIARERIPIPTLPAPSPAATSAVRFLPRAGLGCIVDAAWAPSSDLIALVGTPDAACGYGGYSAHVVIIYRAQTLALVRQMHPDLGVFEALGLAQPRSGTAPVGGSPRDMLIYSTLRWSPDGTRLALSFTLLSPTADSSSKQAIVGLALLDADASRERVLVDRQATTPPTAYIVWDTQSGATVAAPASTIPADAPYSTLVPAHSYGWGAAGALTPGTPLGAPVIAGTPPSSPAGGPVGNPSGGPAFGPWQPGLLSVLETPTNGQQPPSYVYLFTTSFAAWSPDGRYVADGLSVRGLLSVSGQPLPSRAVLSALGYALDNTPIVPVRDHAMEQALAHDLPKPVGLSGQNQSAGDVPIAWRPDGKVLAVLNAHNGYVLRGSDSGQVIRSVDVMQLPPGASASPGSGASWDWPLWSPDGNWLLLPTLALVNMSRLGI